MGELRKVQLSVPFCPGLLCIPLFTADCGHSPHPCLSLVGLFRFIEKGGSLIFRSNEDLVGNSCQASGFFLGQETRHSFSSFSAIESVTWKTHSRAGAGRCLWGVRPVVQAPGGAHVASPQTTLWVVLETCPSSWALITPN